MLASPFTMKVLATFSNIEAGQEYLNIVMESYDTDLFRFIQNCSEGLSVFEIKLISYQMFRGLMYLHSKSIAHRDIKPHNILMKGKKVVLCDFGSAKILSK